MGRKCIVPGCTSNDQNTLVHRFPRKHCKSWQKVLLLQSYDINDLLEKYVVCAHHFRIVDYRNCESKHLNTTALPTLDTVPENEKHFEIRLNEFSPKVSHLNVIPVNANSEKVKKILEKNSPKEKSTVYSNCFTISSIAQDNETNKSNSECEIYEEDNYLENEMLDNEKSNLNSKELFGTEAEYLECDNIIESNNCTLEADHLTTYVELIETNDSDCDMDDENDKQLACNSDTQFCKDYDLYKNLGRNDLIEQLILANNRIQELEKKLANIQEAHESIIQNLSNFNKVLIK